MRESGPGLSTLVADLLTVSRVAEPRQDGLRQLLVTYPAVAANGYTAAPDDGTVHLGAVVNVFDPYPCARGYEGTSPRTGNDVRGHAGQRRGLLRRAPRQPHHRARGAERAAGGDPQAARGRPGRTGRTATGGIGPRETLLPR